MGNTIDLLSSDANDSDNESIHSNPTTLSFSPNPSSPKNEDQTPAAKPKQRAKPKSTKPNDKTGEKDLAKEDASIESRGFHRHGGVSWYNAELVMLGMAFALLKDRKAVDACFPHRSSSTITSCLQRTTKSEDKGWIMPKEADREGMVAVLQGLMVNRSLFKKNLPPFGSDEEVGGGEEESDEEVNDEMEKLRV